MAVNITVAGVSYPVPSGARDTDWAAQQVAFEQALVAAPTYGNLALLNSWLQWSSFQVPRAALLQNNLVTVDGSCTGGSSGSIAFNLPAGKRPATTLVVPAVADGALGSDDPLGAALKLATNGDVTVYFAAASDGNVSFNFVFPAA